MMPALRVGARVPPVRLGELVGDEIANIHLEQHLQGRRVIVVGLPGAFTPVCTGRHIPEFVDMADRLKASGFSEIIAVAPNDPWTIRKWSDELDPEGKLRFLSDGNLELTRKAGLSWTDHGLFIGERCRRYLMIVNNAVVERLSVDDNAATIRCTGASSVLEL